MEVGVQTSETNYPSENCRLSQVLLSSAVYPGAQADVLSFDIL